MIKIEITKDVKQTEELTLETPAFFKTHWDAFIAVFDEKNIMRVYHSGDYTHICSGTADQMKSDLKYCIDENKATEADFFASYNLARQATDLTPKLVEHE